jgi:hypothetical protein
MTFISFEEIEVNPVFDENTEVLLYPGYSYILAISEDGQEHKIPKDENNSDYKRYLIWKGENN